MVVTREGLVTLVILEPFALRTLYLQVEVDVSSFFALNSLVLITNTLSITCALSWPRPS